MLPFPSYYSTGFEGSCSSRDVFLQGLGSAEMMDSGGRQTFSSRSTTEAKACKSHKEAERRRRERINGHLATLRTLLPNTTKTDKASLLAEVVQHMKELKDLAADVASQLGDRCSSSIGNKEEWWCSFPGEKDELTLDYCDNAETMMIRASLSCDDRPDLMSDLTQALKSVGAKVVKAEMATVGGRTKSVLMMERGEGGEELGELQGALKAVIEKPAVSASGQVLPGNKRPRLSLTNDF